MYKNNFFKLATFIGGITLVIFSLFSVFCTSCAAKKTEPQTDSENSAVVLNNDISQNVERSNTDKSEISFISEEPIKPIVSKSDFIGKEFYDPNEPRSIIIHEDYTIFNDITLSKEPETVTNNKPSSIVKQYGHNILHTEEQDYIIFDCEVEGISFLSLLKPNDREFYLGNWEIPYTVDNLKDVYSSMAMLEGVEFKSASSYLTETVAGKVIDYIPKTNKKNEWELSLSIPWAVSKNIAKKTISFNCKWYYYEMRDELPPSNLIISNGFVSAEKPYLYEQNCRAKTIRLTCNGKSETYVLEDTPNFQVLPLASLAKPEPDDIFELEIIDWYDGSKYDDIVISALQYVSVRVK